MDATSRPSSCASASDDATFFPDVPMAVADDLVVTSQTVGRSAELGFFDADGERRASVASEERPIGGVIDGDRFVFVSDTGVIFAATSDDDSPRRLGVIALPTGDTVRSVWPALDGRRLVAAGSGFLAIVDLDGTALFQTTFATADRDPHADADVAVHPGRRQWCVHRARRPRQRRHRRRPSRRRRDRREQRRVRRGSHA